jgi:hypothetical protein
MIVNSFNHLGHLVRQGQFDRAKQILISLSECNEVGLGTSRTRKGKPIGDRTADSILFLFKDVPQYEQRGFIHFEEIQFFVDHIAKDRISDFACSLLKSFLIDYTIDQSKKLGIPLGKTSVPVYDYKTNQIVDEQVDLPTNPENGSAITFVPKRWLRFNPWLDFDEYYSDYIPKERIRPDDYRSSVLAPESVLGSQTSGSLIAQCGGSK